MQTLKSQIAAKEEEISQINAKLSDASKSLSAKMEAINSHRKASNELRQKLTSFPDMQKVRTPVHLCCRRLLQVSRCNASFTSVPAGHISTLRKQIARGG